MIRVPLDVDVLGPERVGLVEQAHPLGFRAVEAPAFAEGPRLSLHLNSGANLLFARTRTMGGLGGGVMARGSFDGGWFADAGLDYGAILGNVGTLHVGGGWQRSGLWALSVSAHAGLMFGDRRIKRNLIPPNTNSI